MRIPAIIKFKFFDGHFIKGRTFCLSKSYPAINITQIKMGLFDFMKKGEEKPVEKKETARADLKNTPPPKPQVEKYTIKSGDSLSKIAQEKLGKAGDWRKIYEANKDTIKDPDKIFPGQEIVIPREEINSQVSNNRTDTKKPDSGQSFFKSGNKA